ncbi:MAG: phage tail protein, partial [Betaproteobacteria bacterium]|nr:phage tail protein [Betaproteobacteria bacterium]
ISAGTQVGTYRVTIAMPGQVAEIFDNLALGLTGNAVWVAIANAINNGSSLLRGPSAFVVATAGAGTGAPAVGTTGQSQTFTAGTDGASAITSAAMVGQDVVPRKGMYALRNTQTSIGMLADLSDTATFSLQVAFGLSEGIYMIGTSPAGDSIANAVAVKAAAGIDSYAFKYLFGDWVYFNDTVNGQIRVISPQGFIAGRLANLAPQHSSLNKPLYGIVGTQKSYQNQVYSAAELQSLGQAGIDLITNPIPAGNMFGARFGHNSSSNPVTNGDNYTRMTNYLAYTFNAGMGLFVGQLQSQQPTDPLRRKVGATLSSFLTNMQQQVQLDDFTVQCDLNNNPPSRIALGYLQADVNVRYLAVVEKFLINVQGGQSVQINRQSTTLNS